MTNAHVSFDLDPIDTHLAGYGIDGPPCDLIYRRSLPRILELLARLGIRSTFFVVARDAEREAPLLRAAAAAGHEIASHSLSHPIPFVSLPAVERRKELRESRQRLEDALSRPVVGFRAPGWDVDEATLDEIAEAGYRYDASILPSPALLPGAVLRFVLSAGRKRELSLRRWMRLAFSDVRPHDRGRLREFPLAVSPFLRVPFTHTLWYVAPAAVCRRIRSAIYRARTPLSYMLHAADLVGLREDGVDTRLERHPGMQLSLVEKTALVDGCLREIQRSYEVVPYAEVLSEESFSRIALDAEESSAMVGCR
jgi:hypothetical protein